MENAHKHKLFRNEMVKDGCSTEGALSSTDSCSLSSALWLAGSASAAPALDYEGMDAGVGGDQAERIISQNEHSKRIGVIYSIS